MKVIQLFIIQDFLIKPNKKEDFLTKASYHIS